jgi:hypothetical protein
LSGDRWAAVPAISRDTRTRESEDRIGPRCPWAIRPPSERTTHIATARTAVVRKDQNACKRSCRRTSYSSDQKEQRAYAATGDLSADPRAGLGSSQYPNG